MKMCTIRQQEHITGIQRVALQSEHQNTNLMDRNFPVLQKNIYTYR